MSPQGNNVSVAIKESAVCYARECESCGGVGRVGPFTPLRTSTWQRKTCPDCDDGNQAVHLPDPSEAP